MPAFRLLRTGIVVAAIVATGACAPQTNAPQTNLPRTSAPQGAVAALPKTKSVRTARQQRLGDENHPKILQKYGGAYNNPRLAAYVTNLGRRIAAVSEQPAEKWTFTVLDTPQVNAFALPGGYIYLTRGLMALANSEAEVAGVLGHEIGHVTAGHSSLRQNRTNIALGALLGAQILGSAVGLDPGLVQGIGQAGQIAAAGFLASHSREDELAADNLGVRYLARAGYDPYAQAEFLESMGASAALEAKLAGRTYDPNATGFFASHPATGDRTRRAIEIAQTSGEVIPVGAARNVDRYLAMIDGLTFGDSPEQGFVRGRDFLHPVLGFAYSSPSGFRVSNAPESVTATGPDGARFVLDGGGAAEVSLRRYMTQTWMPLVAKAAKAGQMRGLRDLRINGLAAAETTVPLEIKGKRYDALLVAIRMNDRIYRFTGLSPRGANRIVQYRQAAASFRRLGAAESAGLTAQRVDVARVRPGDTVRSLSRRMAVDELAEDRFRVLNGLKPGEQVRPGQVVKLIR
ncbi:MAG: M48 family metalloprotease [Pseudomonadota bacterium]